MKIGIVGSGTMGVSIASLILKNGYKLVHYVRNEEANASLINIQNKFLKKEERRGKLRTDYTLFDVLNCYEITNKIEDLSDCSLVIEAISENIEIKKELIKELNHVLTDDAIIATNTSSLSITELASFYKSPSNVIGLHFFNPAPVMQLVEIIKGFLTAPLVVSFCNDLCKDLGKETIFVDEYPGFIVNRLLMPMINEAIHLLDFNIATIKDIDSAMKYGANHPLGPLELADFIGLDVVSAILETLYKETGEQRYKPSYTLKKMCLSGNLGRKSGQGFYKY